MQLSLVKNLMHVVSVGTQHVSLNIQLPLGIQDVFAEKLKVAISVGTELKWLC